VCGCLFFFFFFFFSFRLHAKCYADPNCVFFLLSIFFRVILLLVQDSDFNIIEFPLLFQYPPCPFFLEALFSDLWEESFILKGEFDHPVSPSLSPPSWDLVVLFPSPSAGFDLVSSLPSSTRFSVSVPGFVESGSSRFLPRVYLCGASFP